MGAPGVATIPEDDELGGGATGASSSLPPISGAAPNDEVGSAAAERQQQQEGGSEAGSSGVFDPDLLNPAEKARLAKEYLAKKASQDWLSVHGAPKPEDKYLETVFGAPCHSLCYCCSCNVLESWGKGIEPAAARLQCWAAECWDAKGRAEQSDGGTSCSAAAMCLLAFP